MKMIKDDIDKQAEREGNALSFMSRNRINSVRKTGNSRFVKTKHIDKRDFHKLFKD